MGRRSRRRVETGAPADGPRPRAQNAEPPPAPTTRAERDAARRRRAAGEGRPDPRGGDGRRPPPPWGRFPLSELVILLALVFLALGLFGSGSRARTLLLAALVLGSLAGGELAFREHFSGFRSHTTLLAATAGTLVMVATFLGLGLIGLASGALPLVIALAVGGAVFAFAFQALRQVFIRRSGGLGFR